ncbi:uncharacterized protein LAESUDRAFT_761359 [Laetiporus sulphureus 93-53]|uniref:F-box domain-containing protein n=1 Tax=Laetiporus sulphureus 93-53 TaxID=1314785 RepID=A0A165D6E6_9APHY|nr:uncharacterized protein LAESUDRAFT_761359 [Laetiporus sulphureus 93-53]KZT04239.1 hypothetical protein LAESUDRAFT_761359 [Laetiporus sulphureus 93-53]
MGLVLSVLSILFYYVARIRRAIHCRDTVPAKEILASAIASTQLHDGSTGKEFLPASSSVAISEADQDALCLIHEELTVIPATPSRDAFFHVPNELVLAIAELLPDSDLVCLTTLSCHMHYITVPIYLRRHGLRISGADKVVVLLRDDAIATLSFWRRSLLFQCPRILRVGINTPSEYMRLGRFFASLGSDSPLRNVKLFLDSPPGQQLVEVLDTLRHSCVSSITLWHRSSIICRPVLPCKHVSCSPDFSFSTLETFQPQVAALFDSSLSQWTLQMINSTSLVELTLVTPGLASPPWSLILERLAIPTLRILRIEGELTHLALDRFLQRHRGLEELHIGYHSDYGRVARRRTPPSDLSHLWVLAVPTMYLLHILGDERTSAATLERLTILPSLHCEKIAEFVCSLSKVLTLVSELEELYWLNCTFPPFMAAGVDEIPNGIIGLPLSDVLLPNVKYVVLEQASSENKRDSFSALLLDFNHGGALSGSARLRTALSNLLD